MFGTDGKLYGATGDLNRNLTEQSFPSTGNASSHVGGIYRLNSDLTTPADNPFSGGKPTRRPACIARDEGYLTPIGLMIACTAPVMRAGPSVKKNSDTPSFTSSAVYRFSRM